MPEATLTSELQPINDENALIDDGRETMIKVDHVTMEFNMASEQLNSLKEYAIAIAKRKLYFEKFVALDDISFEVKKGDVFGILGTNGSGKSTLLKIIAGVLQPTKGSCEINGNIAPLIELGAGFDMELSARENIYLNGSLLGYSKAFIEDHFNDIVEFAEIEKFLDMPMKNYSSGMVARIAFAIATVIVPEILIVDEVLSVGDFMFQQKCEDRINELIDKHGVTVLLVSHSNDQIERLCNKAIWIEKGHARIIGKAEQVCNAYRVLGGRKGSAKSENIVFQAMHNLETRTKKPLHIKKYIGKNHFEISSDLTLQGWSKGSSNIILVPDSSHVFFSVASPLAAAMKAPVLPYNQEIPASVLQTIIKLNPDNIYIFINESTNVKADLTSCFLDYNLPLPIEIPFGEGCQSFNAAILQTGRQLDAWPSSCAYVCSFTDVELSFYLSCIASKQKTPLLITGNEDLALNKKVCDELLDCSIKTLNIYTHKKMHLSDLWTEFRMFNVRLYANDKTSIIHNDYSPYLHETTKDILICDYLNDWQKAITIPSLSAKQNAQPYIYDRENLDITASIITKHQYSNQIECYFVNTNLSDIEYELLGSRINSFNLEQSI